MAQARVARERRAAHEDATRLAMAYLFFIIVFLIIPVEPVGIVQSLLQLLSCP